MGIFLKMTEIPINNVNSIYVKYIFLKFYSNNIKMFRKLLINFEIYEMPTLLIYRLILG